MKEVEYQLILDISGVHVEETKRLIDERSDDFYVAKLAASYKVADQIDAFNKTNPSDPIPRTEEQVLHGDIKEHWTKITPFDFFDINIHGGFEQQNGKLVQKKNRTLRVLNTSSKTDEFVARFQELGPQEFIREFNNVQFYNRVQRDKKEILALRKNKGNEQRINTKLLRIQKWEEAFQDWHFETYNKFLETGTPEKSSKYSDKSGIKSFSLPEGAQLSEICLSFISDDTIKVKIRDRSIKLNYAEIGFKDRRKGSLWDSRWEVLRDDFAQNNGIVSFDTQNTKYDVKMAVYAINKRLKEFLVTDKRLFSYDGKAKAYKTKFKISYNVGGKTDSDEQSQSKDEHSSDVERLLKLPKDEKIKEYQQIYGLSEDEVNELKKKSEQVLNADLKASLDT